MGPLQKPLMEGEEPLALPTPTPLAPKDKVQMRTTWLLLALCAIACITAAQVHAQMTTHLGQSLATGGFTLPIMVFIALASKPLVKRFL